MSQNGNVELIARGGAYQGSMSTAYLTSQALVLLPLSASRSERNHELRRCPTTLIPGLCADFAFTDRDECAKIVKDKQETK